MRTETEHTTFPKDDAPSPYLIDKVELDVKIGPVTSRVRAILTVTPRAGTAPGTPLVLDGDDLRLDSIAMDGGPLPLTAYDVAPTMLTIIEPPARSFALETEVTLEPEKNLTLAGFYRTGGIWRTQCEPDGFRRITYYLDRPDVLAPFKVRMSANKTLAPVLLANGNLIDRGDLEDGRHFAVWEDSVPKPASAFAMFAGPTTDTGALGSPR